MTRFERYYPDMAALHHRFQTAPCFLCQIVKALPNPEAHIVYEDDHFIAFLWKNEVGWFADQHPKEEEPDDEITERVTVVE